MVHDLRRNTKHCQKDLGENVKCLYSDVGNALKIGNTFQQLNIYVAKWNVWRRWNGEREGGRQLLIMLTTPKYYNLNSFLSIILRCCIFVFKCFINFL